MSKQLLVLGCSQIKRESPGLLPAIDRYDGSSYRVLRSYLRGREWPSNLSVAVLSAKYGLVGGFTGIEDYDERMTPDRATEWAPKCSETLNEWAGGHSSIHFSLGKDYLPAVRPAIEQNQKKKIEVFEGPIGIKLNQIKTFLEKTDSPLRNRTQFHGVKQGRIKYFLPDWDDLLDEDFDFESDSFSGSTRNERNDKHCCVLMKPKNMCDGVLVSLAQHSTTKGPLRKISGTESNSLSPRNLRSHFGLRENQFLFGDCGAFSYVNEENPSISVEQAAALYELHGFDFGASVDHIPTTTVLRADKKTELSKSEREQRVRITKRNAEDFIDLVKRRSLAFTPVGTIQALSPKGYANTAKYYYDLGYRHLAIGGLVPLSDSSVEEIVTAVMTAVKGLRQRPWVHLFGVFRPKLQEKFRLMGVNSFDSATYFRKAWLRSDQNYLGANGKWYAALRVPMTSDGRTRKKLEDSGSDIVKLERQERNVLTTLCKFDRGEVSVPEALDAVLSYDELLTRSSDLRSLRTSYLETLKEKPWRSCDCSFCKAHGIHILIFRGANRNKRRGAHNTLQLYKSIIGTS